MEWVRWMFRLVLAMMVAGLATLAGFGMLLAGLWHFGVSAISYQWATAGISAVAALWLGGLVAGWLAKDNRLMLSVLFGALFGGFSFTYILGPVPLALALMLVSSLVAGAGGMAYQWIWGSDRRLAAL